MVASEKLLQATLNRLGNRIGKKVINSLTDLERLISTSPEKVRNEWELFQQEVFDEAERLEKESGEQSTETKKESTEDIVEKTPQGKINQIRAKIVEISDKLEAKN